MQLNYVYTAVYRVVGFSSLVDGRPMRIDVGLENATAELVVDANAALADVDRAKSFANIALRMLFKREQFGPDLITAIDRIAQDRASARSERGQVFSLL